MTKTTIGNENKTLNVNEIIGEYFKEDIKNVVSPVATIKEFLELYPSIG